MSDVIVSGAVKVIELVGISTKSFDDAIEQAVSKASQSIKGITGVDVQKMSAKVKDGKVASYSVNLKVAFAVK